MDDAPILQPLTTEVAAIARDFDYGESWANQLAGFEDDILNEKLGGQLAAYRKLITDDQVKATFQQRRAAVVASELEIEPGAAGAAALEAADFLREQLGAIDFDRITDRLLYGLIFGYGVAECLWRETPTRVELAEIKVRRPERFRFRHTGELVLLTRAQAQGEVLPPAKFWHYSTALDDDSYYGIGLGHYLYWPVWFKRNNIKFWLMFQDKFASPTGLAKIPDSQINDKTVVTRARNILKSIQADGGVVIPESMAVELIEAARSGTTSYDGLTERMNQAISKVVLSQTMTTDDGSSLSQAQVHKGVKLEVVKSDADLLCSTFNHGPARWLTTWNFGPEVAAPRVWRRLEPPEDLLARAQRDHQIYQLGFRPTLDYIRATYGEGWEEAPPPAANPFADSAPAFAETLLGQLDGHRGDQTELLQAATQLAHGYRDLIGARVDDLRAMLAETGDLAAFNERLEDLFQNAPPAQSIEALQRAGVAARLMGRLRGQHSGGE